MIADISYPDYETRLAILKTKIQERGIDLDDAVCDFYNEKNPAEHQGVGG